MTLSAPNTKLPNARSTRIVPLGGLGEIGMNCLALEQPDGIMVVDCGIAFPEEDRGVDLIHPDFSYLRANRDRLSGVFITHGHEDHIGALPYLLSELDVPVWGPNHALALIRRRLRERKGARAPSECDLRSATPTHRYRVGPFEVEPIRVSHSIIEATALAIRSAGGTIVHTGDFKFDPQPADGEPTDERRLEQLGDAGVNLLLSDSTNAENLGAVQSESEVAHALEELVAGCKRRVVVGLFSSNIQRLIHLGEIAKRHNRRIGLLGRSLRTHVETACQLGHLQWGSQHRVLIDQLSSCPPDNLLLLAGGTQAEAGSGLARLAAGTHQNIQLSPGDRVILSSRVIPGNGKKVSNLMSEFLRRDIELYHAQDRREIHASGHATRGELEHMLHLVRPDCFIPVHGTRHHLQSHADLARENGVGDRLILENGQTAWLSERSLSRGGPVPSGRIYIDRGGSPVAPPILRQRATLAREGLVQLIVVLDSQGAPLAPGRLVVVGVPGFEDPEVADKLTRVALAHFNRQSARWRREGQDPAERLSRFLGWKLEEQVGRRPTVRVELLQPKEA